MNKCNSKNCTAKNGYNHSEECIKEHDEAVTGVSSDQVIINKALDDYIKEVRDPSKGYMITNAKDTINWLRNYSNRNNKDKG